jgi:hypothetical protein
VSHIDYVAQENHLNHVGDLLLAELGRNAYQKYPFLYATVNNSDYHGDNVRPGNAGCSRHSNICEVPDTTGMKFQVLMVLKMSG